MSRHLLLLLFLVLAGCTRDPHMAMLNDAARQMESIIRSRVLLDIVHDNDPQMRPSTAALASMSGGVAANFPVPPGDIAYIQGDKATQAWCIVVIGDDAGKKVRIEGYGDDLSKPLIVKELDFPPG